MTQRWSKRPQVALLDDGIKPVYLVETRAGRRIRITAAHPLLSQHGWRPLEQLQVGDFIAAPSIIPVFGTTEIPDAEIDLLASQVCATGHVPASAFTLPAVQVEGLLRSIFARELTTGGRGVRCADWKAAADLAHLMQRLGVCSRRHSDQDGVRVAIANPIDTLPREVWDDVIKAKGERTWASINAAAGKPASHNWHRVSPHARAARRLRCWPRCSMTIVFAGGPRRP